ncbi:hypothetical protein LINPERHAP1_LOCUS35023 [Linum perenne]
MAPPSPPLSFLILISFIFIFSSSILVKADDRAPHGIVNENPLTFSSTSAADFFRHNTQSHVKKQPCSGCTPLPVAAHVMERPSHNGGSGEHHLNGGSIAGIVAGIGFVVLLAMSVYYVVTTRRANVNKASNNSSVHTHHVGSSVVV